MGPLPWKSQICVPRVIHLNHLRVVVVTKGRVQSKILIVFTTKTGGGGGGGKL